jgi:tetratricopeptide (TPR) repeat protein
MTSSGISCCALLVCLDLAAASDVATIAPLYERGLAGDQRAVLQCISALDHALQTEPDNQLARVYLGSAWTLRSRDLGIGLAKLSALNKGIALMDEAVAGAPGDAHVRLVRAITCQALPFFTGRPKMARGEFIALVEAVTERPEKLAPADRQLLYLEAGFSAKNSGDNQRAIELWKRGLDHQTDPKLTEKLKAALAHS